MEVAIFAAGCFWGVQAVFDQVKGVINTTVGYTGGHVKNPSYKDVCNKNTGHAEAVRIEFDEKKVSYEKLVGIFFMNHDPTTMNRQGPDVGEQYRSVIFYVNDKQKKIAEKGLNEYKKKLKKKIVTEITKAGEFYLAEDYHQKYYKTHNITCHVKLAT